jgi:MFS family permease
MADTPQRLTPMQRNVWVLSALGVALDGFDFFIIGVAMPLIERQLGASPWQVGLIGAAAVLGAVAGCLTLGPFTDKFGRKTLYLVDLGFFVVFALLSALAWDVWSLIVIRFLLGVGIGADYPISATYVAETMPSRVRGRMVAATIGFQALGMLVGALIGLLILALDPDESAWRWMLAMGAIPAIIMIILRSWVPESPRWLATQGRLAEAQQAAVQLLGPDGIHRTDLGLEESAGKAETSLALFSRKLLPRTILACVPWFLMDIATYGIGLFTPIILGTLAFSNTSADPFARLITNVEGAAFLDLFLIVGFALGILLIERLGRIHLQLIGFAMMTVALVMLAVSGGNTVLVFVAFILFNTFMNLGPNTTTYVIPAELFPTRLRASGHGLAAAAGKLGAACGIFFLPVFNADYGISVTLLFVAAASGLGFLVTWWFQLETTGKTLQELELG